MFVLTINNSEYKENVTHLVSKIAIFNEDLDVDLNNLSKMLYYIGMKGVFIFSIDTDEPDIIENTTVEIESKIHYIKVGINKFIEILNDPNRDFMEYNKNSLYILRNGNHEDIKNLIRKIQGKDVSVVRGSSQKSHIMSPLELRFFSYLMALSDFNYNRISYLNSFNSLTKDRYLPFFKK